jgi:hypothetical protein
MPAVAMPRDRDSAPVASFVLPVSGLAVSLRAPTGAEEVLLAERRAEDAALALALAERLGRAETPLDWSALSITDIDVLIARLRIAMVGDRVIGEAACVSAACGEKVDLSFRLSDWLDHHRPRPGLPRGRGWRAAPAADAPGWYVLTVRNEDAARFRVPTLADQIAVQDAADPAAALAARVTEPAAPPARLRARAEAAMEMLAPALAGPMQGQCPHCGEALTALFHPRQYCLRELRDRARCVYEDIDALAERYHWSEQAILRLPAARRSQYVERARQARAA